MEVFDVINFFMISSKSPCFKNILPDSFIVKVVQFSHRLISGDHILLPSIKRSLYSETGHTGTNTGDKNCMKTNDWITGPACAKGNGY